MCLQIVVFMPSLNYRRGGKDLLMKTMNVVRTKGAMRGFTLIEMIVAVGIFAIMMSVVAGAFSSGAFAFRSSKELQRNVESAQYAMNTMAKHLRTSSIVFPDGEDDDATELRFYEYSSNRCFEYEIDSNALRVQWAGISDLPVSDPDDIDELLSVCDSGAGIGWTDWSDMTSGEVDGSFHVVPSDDGLVTGDKRIGRVTMRLKVRNEGATTDDLATTIQTTVSLRDYGYVEY